MKIGIVLSGHIRTLEQSIDSWKLHVDKYNADIVLSTWDYTGVWTPKTSVVNSQDAGTVIHDENNKITEDQLLNIFPFTKIEIEKYEDHATRFSKETQPCYEWRDSLPPLYHSYRPHNYYSTYYKRYKGFQLLESLSTEYDAVILSRPDLELNHINDNLFNNLSRVYTLENPDKSNVWWVNDILFLTNHKYAKSLAYIYTEFFNKFENAKSENTPNVFFEPHGLLKHHMVINQIPVFEPGPSNFYGKLIR